MLVDPGRDRTARQPELRSARRDRGRGRGHLPDRRAVRQLLAQRRERGNDRARRDRCLRDCPRRPPSRGRARAGTALRRDLEPEHAGGPGLVGAVGFEPTASCSQSMCATRLRYAPTAAPIIEAAVRGSREPVAGSIGVSRAAPDGSWQADGTVRRLLIPGRGQAKPRSSQERRHPPGRASAMRDRVLLVRARTAPKVRPPGRSCAGSKIGS